MIKSFIKLDAGLHLRVIAFHLKLSSDPQETIDDFN